MSDSRHAYERLVSGIEEAGTVPCQKIPEVFFPDDFAEKQLREEAIRTARALCSSCPVRMACFEYAIVSKERHGIWAGTLPSER